MKTKHWKKVSNAANPSVRRPPALGLRWPGVAGLAALTLAANAPAAESPAKPSAAPSITDFADLGLDQLANMSVTSVGKKEQKLTAAPAAIYVLTEEDVRRSGATSIPEALRLVPGLEVARVVGKSGTKGTITVSARRDGEWAEVRIRDTGTGIPEKARAKVFDPFFTTKGVGKGTGQGLAIAHNVIVEKHGGTLAFETETGKGTVFIIRIPIQSVSNQERKAA